MDLATKVDFFDVTLEETFQPSVLSIVQISAEL
jgi:hypothetical protein